MQLTHWCGVQPTGNTLPLPNMVPVTMRSAATATLRIEQTVRFLPVDIVASPTCDVDVQIIVSCDYGTCADFASFGDVVPAVLGCLGHVGKMRGVQNSSPLSLFTL